MMSRPVAEIVQHGPTYCKLLTDKAYLTRASRQSRNLLILLILIGWLTSLDNFRNWLIRSAA
jgi:hypothetical protein